MERICLYGAATAFLMWAGMASAQCPTFVHKTAVVQYSDSGATLPVHGTVVCAVRYQGGLYKAALGTYTPTLIPNTSDAVNANSVQITEDGQWVLYNAGGPTLIRIDGQYKTKVPGTASGSEGCCTFWWHAPSGKVEVVYRASGDKIAHAVPVTFGAAAPTFGTDHIIAQFNEVMEFTMGVSGNHLFTRVDDSHFGVKMITLPNNGNGTATDANFYVPAGTDYPSFGCMCTISHGGAIGCYNAGYDQWCGCMADEFCLLRHKSFVLLPFQESTAPSVGWQAVLLKTMALSVNWAPHDDLLLNPKDTTHGLDTNNLGSDFKGWCFTNDSTYVVGDAMGQKTGADSGTIWLVHYPTNTWTRVLRMDGAHLLAFPAVWIDKTVNTIEPWQGSRLQYRGVPMRGSRYIVNSKGRIVSNAKEALSGGVYYAVGGDGVMKRVVVGR
jgi:hypothetical protein